MLKSRFTFSFNLAHISLAFVGLMWVLPFLYYHHAYPITTFYQESGAALLGLCAMPLLLTARFWQAPEVPRLMLLPVGLMMLLMVQFFIGRVMQDRLRISVTVLLGALANALAQINTANWG